MRRKNIPHCRLCALLLAACLLLPMLPVRVPAEQTQTVRVGWYEDSYHITGANGQRSGYGYEYEQAVAAYTGWNYEYVKGDWSELLEMLQRGEIDLMAALSYTDERAQTMLFSDLPMGEERYYLYADLRDPALSASDLSTLNGRRIIVMRESVLETAFSQWEKIHGVETRHVDIDNMERASKALENQKADGVISAETPIWVEAGLSAIAQVGGSEIYYGISKSRPELKQQLDSAMRAMESDKPFYGDELYARYLAAQSVAVLSGEEKQWLAQHGELRVGFWTGDSGVSMYDAQTGALSGILCNYIGYAVDCLNDTQLSFALVGYETQQEELEALRNGEIDFVFHAAQNPYAAEQEGVSLSNTVWTLTAAAMTTQREFSEETANRLAVPKDNLALRWYAAYNYPQWEILEYDTQEAAEQAVKNGAADCFLTRSSQVADYIQNNRFYGNFLLKASDCSFAVRRGDAVLLSILNKTLKTMPSSMLTGALSVYDNMDRKVTLRDFVMDNLAVVSAVFAAVFALVLTVILVLLRRARKAASQAQTLNGQLQQSQRSLQEALLRAEDASSAKTTFLFNMSHDIRTPMNAILGFTALAERQPEDTARVREYLEKIRLSGKGMLSILDNVLELSRIESGKTTLEETPQMAGEVFDACLVMMNPEIEKRHHTVKVTKDISCPYTYFDAARVTEIILNILSNAIKYTADGGTIRCELRQSPHLDAGWVYQSLTVTDNGIGMSEEYQKHIFETFSRERSTTLSGVQGTGLGMGIVKKLVDLMNGTIEVESRLGQGTTVSFRIPVRIASFEDTQPKRATIAGEKTRLRGRRILLAEDNDLNAEIACAMLEEQGLLVDRAADGVQCVEKLEKCPEGFYDLILMDIQMPAMDGYQATQKIRSLENPKKAQIPIIAMTANAFSEDRAKALEMGMNDHVAKPFDMDVLVAAMLKYIP